MDTVSSPPVTPTAVDLKLDLDRDGLRLSLELGDGPARITGLTAPGAAASAVRPHPLVEVFTAHERHTRMTLGYTASTVGSRLRVVSHHQTDAGVDVVQHDEHTGLTVQTRITVLGHAAALQLAHTLINDGDEEIAITASSTLSLQTAAAPEALTLISGRSEWLGEGRWRSDRVADLLPDLGFAALGQPDRTGFGQTSAGGWPTGSVLPTGVLVADDGTGIGWQIESSAGWQWTLSRGEGGVALVAGGPTDREHQGEVRLAPGARFETVTAGVVVSNEGADGVFGALTRYRRQLRVPREAERDLPVIYNDYMNTLMGQPSTEALLPLIDAAAAAGAEYFCIDAGWFTDSTEYWGEVGEWREAPTRFTGGLRTVLDAIRAAGLRPGIWLEPESVGLDSPVSESLPAESFFQRHGSAVIEQRRKHLDLRHPAARSHLDEVVDRLVLDYGIEYFKLDYNIEPGPGTDLNGLAPGHGLLEHTRALREWLIAVQTRHPAILLENCASGAMRMDYHLLAVTHLQSTSDQQETLKYAAIAAAAPASVLPEQAGNWAYPARGMSRGEIAVTLVSGLSGRLYLAGFLPQLDDEAGALVRDAVRFATAHRNQLQQSEPFWPLGLPGWSDATIALGLRRPSGIRHLFVWSRGAAGSIVLPGATGLRQVFPEGPAWGIAADGTASTIEVPEGPDAAVFEYQEL